MLFFENGLVIQELVDSEYFSHLSCSPSVRGLEKYFAYRGLSRFLSWPLAARSDELSKQMTVETRGRWFYRWYDEDHGKYYLEVVPELNFGKQYFLACNSLHLKTRIIFCKTDRDMPLWEGIIPKRTWLGFDYATSQGFYSTIPEDLLLKDTSQALTKYKSRLNINQLFEHEDDLNSYISDRQLLIDSGVPLELGDYCRYELFEIDNEIIDQ